MTEHRPTPWSMSEHPDNGEDDIAVYYINSNDSVFNGDVATTYADDGGHNARMIVACVNAHEELLASLKELLPAYRRAVGLHSGQDDAYTVRAHNAIARIK